MKGTWLIFKSEVKKQWNIEKRYKLGVISDLIVYYALFMLLYLLIRSSIGSIPKSELNLKISVQVVSYISWFFFSFTINFVFNNINKESSEGTIEQLAIGPNSLNKIFYLKLLVISLRNMILIIPLQLLLMISTGTKIIFSFYTILIFFIMIFGTVGLSLLLGGLQIYYKNIGQFPFIITILFLSSALFDMSKLPSVVQNILYFLPFAKGVDLIKQSVLPNINIPFMQLVFLLINSIVYLFIGIYIFNYFVNKSKNSGRLGSF
ncbi:ABC transporter permease [Eubacterium multiforme]|uniref:ABC-type polysaccharide/polyol phosphate export permease n=1 Tax=Eubacterium multiforme TaxID=83339 RepID=A0ABT9USA3_9FIRM|nr:ABC transporter permease [Eubacterium multiforme]MDQ0149196.1 ABC-type polysaccharide/polyol phosphate export permease [Eubacterium multiforme]